jgi:membrane-associated protease RseP (regulator of RpoE activity)
MLGVVFFIVAILGSVMLHEAGHFVTARWSGMKVSEFFVGFGPRVWSFRRGETEYGIKALPLGGYVKIAGMNPYEEVAPEDLDRVYRAKPAWKRAIVLSAGSIMHFVIAFVIFVGIFAFAGIRGEPTLTIEEVAAGTPAAEVGFRAGDVIERVNGVAIATWADVVEIIREHPEERIQIEILRDGEPLTLAPKISTLPGEEPPVGFLGVGPEQPLVTEPLPIAFKEAGESVVFLAKGSVGSFFKLFTPSSFGDLFAQATGKEERPADGAVSIFGAGAIAKDLSDEGRWRDLLGMIASLNVFIGVFNLVPLPPLDGGHLAVLTYEKIRGRQVDMAKLAPVTMAVLFVMLSLFILLFAGEIVNPPSLPG